MEFGLFCKIVDGEVQHISNRLREPDDAPLAAMPTGYGPWTYDQATQTAVPVPEEKQPLAIRFSNHFVPRAVIVALVLRLSARWDGLPEAERKEVQAVIDKAGEGAPC